MLTLNERNGLKEILDGLEDEELFRLVETVTKRMFTITRIRTEAVETILSCTEKPSDLLQRQKITKKIIFNYLIKKQSVLSSEWSKFMLVQKCLEIWQSNESVKDNDYRDDNESKSTNVSQPVTLQMGIEFSNWFFDILNTMNNFGPEHFWPTCNLSACLFSPSEQKEVSLTGASDVVAFLGNLVMLDKYKFGVNKSSDSIIVEMEMHGLVKIMTCGVLYQHLNCVGLFEFAFGLVKNPDSEYNYKIQVVKLKMQVNCVSQVPPHVSNYVAICQSA